MAANKVEKGSLRKKSAVRSSLANPYVLTWPTVDKTVHYSIMNEIRRRFPTILGQKIIHKTKRKQLESTAEETLTDANKIILEQLKKKQELRKCLAIGINEVTKCLERDELNLALACRSVEPDSMIDHLMVLGVTRQTPTLGLHGLGEVMGPLLQCKKVTALGFKKQQKETAFDPLVEFITPLAPEIIIPWLKPFKEKQPTSKKKCDLTENKEGAIEINLDKNKSAGVKRGCEDSEKADGVKKKKVEKKDANVIEVNDDEINTDLVILSEQSHGGNEEEGTDGKNMTSYTKKRTNNYNFDKDRQKAKHESEVEGVRVSFEPAVFKQIIPNLNKKKQRK